MLDDVTGARWIAEAGQPAFSSNPPLVSAFSVVVLMDVHLQERSLPPVAGRVMSLTRFFAALTRHNLRPAARPRDADTD